MREIRRHLVIFQEIRISTLITSIQPKFNPMNSLISHPFGDLSNEIIPENICM